MQVAQEMGLERPYLLLSGKKCLVADDNLINQQLFAFALKQAGMEVFLMGNGEEVIRHLVEEVHPDIILLDINMPVMDGYNTAWIIREQLHLNIPVAGMSATIQAEEREKCLEMGMNDYLIKPFEPEDLYRRIMRMLYPKLYDLRMLEELGNADQMREILEMFLQNFPRMLGDLVRDAGQGEWEKVYREAHRIKGSAGVIHAVMLLELARQTEAEGRKLEEAGAGGMAEGGEGEGASAGKADKGRIMLLIRALQTSFEQIAQPIRDYMDNLKTNI